MTPEEFNQWMKENTLRISDAVVLPSAQLAVNLVRNRVINTGNKADGSDFSAYTSAYLKKKSERHTVSFKNFYFTGEMWKSFGIKERQDSGGRTVVKAYMDSGGRGTVTNQSLMEIHSGKEDTELIEASEDEDKKIQVFADKKLQALWA